MQFSTVVLGLLLAVSSTAAPSPQKHDEQNFFDLSKDIMSYDLHVPGDNPLEFCATPTDDILQIEYVNLSPNPPKAGETLSIKAKGNLKEKVEEGAKVHLQVKYGLITLINQQADLCEQIKNVDLTCPLEKGDITFTKDIDLPKEIPSGNYQVLADVFTKDGDKITCLRAKVTFSRG